MAEGAALKREGPHESGRGVLSKELPNVYIYLQSRFCFTFTIIPQLTSRDY